MESFDQEIQQKQTQTQQNDSQCDELAQKIQIIKSKDIVELQDKNDQLTKDIRLQLTQKQQLNEELISLQLKEKQAKQ